MRILNIITKFPKYDVNYMVSDSFFLCRHEIKMNTAHVMCNLQEVMKMEKPSFWRSKRYLVVVVLFLNFSNFQILRNNINIAIVEITAPASSTNGNKTAVESIDSDWNSATVGLILSISAYGGLLSFLGGFIVDYFGGAMTGTLCSFLAGVMTLLHPIALYDDFRLFLLCRFIMGAFETFFYASCFDVSVKWFPENERSLLMSLSFNGLNVGTAAVYPLCGYVAYTWGWEMVFYVTGAISVVTSGLGIIFIRNSPSQDRFISKKEQQYILERTTDAEANVNHPYKSILTSKPVWSLCAISFSYMWIASVLGCCLPIYINDLTHKNTNEIGLISSIPNIAYIFAIPLSEKVISYWKNHSNYSVTQIYKICIICACVSTSLSLVIVAISPDFMTSMISFVSIEFETAFMMTIIVMIPVHLHPPSASFVNGLTLVFISSGSFLSQSISMAMVPNHSQQEWNRCFYLSSIILLISGLIFSMYGSGEPQPWSVEETLESSIKSEENNDSRKISIISSTIADRIHRRSSTSHYLRVMQDQNIMEKTSFYYRQKEAG